MPTNSERPLPAEDVQEGVVAVVARAGRFLMIRRAPGILAGGAWCFVGGGIESGETCEEALRREFLEEVGAKLQPLRKVWEYRRTDGKLLLYWWLAKCRDETLSPNACEVSEYGWFTPAEIACLPGVLESNLEFIRGPICRAILRES